MEKQGIQKTNNNTNNNDRIQKTQKKFDDKMASPLKWQLASVGTAKER